MLNTVLICEPASLPMGFYSGEMKTESHKTCTQMFLAELLTTVRKTFKYK